MMLYPTNSADRRQQPCTTTIRSRRAHPRHVLDTAALNAYVPNNVGSKSHNELTWNHVVSVFTFFGLLMTALVSLCCWSHFQFIVERRRLAANTEFNSQHRRLPADTQITVEGDTLNKINGVYTKNGAVPEWFKKGNVKTYFQGGGGIDFNLVDNSTITWTPEESCPTCVNPKKRDGQYFDKSTKKMQSAKGKVHREDCTKCDKNKDGKPTGKLYGKERTATRDANGWWPKITDSTGTGKCRPHYVNGDCIIFFCAIQNKWHMCGKDGIIYYRVDNGETAALPSFGWNSIKMKGAKDAAPTIQ